jgi:hypothetical protein
VTEIKLIEVECSGRLVEQGDEGDEHHEGISDDKAWMSKLEPDATKHEPTNLKRKHPTSLIEHGPRINH